jgi:hypothetical protein
VCRRPSARLILEIDVGEGLTVEVADDEAGIVVLIERPARWQPNVSVQLRDQVGLLVNYILLSALRHRPSKVGAYFFASHLALPLMV